ncbi:MAG: nicotinate-nucleotide adenylyltransferase [Verrucomicrobiales bacterium]
MQRIGMYGGSFDPVHLGHLLVAQAAREELLLDKIFFIPAAQSPFKPDRKLTSDSLRAAMLRIALCGRNYAEVDTRELERGGVSYTIDTVRDYRNEHPQAELFYLIGGDHTGMLPKWRDAEELAREATFVIIPRPGQAEEEAPRPFRAKRLSGFPLGLSSSQIRARVKEGLPIDLLTGPSVAELIHKNALYL